MAELGERRRFHLETGELASELGLDPLVTVGAEAVPTRTASAATSHGGRARGGSALLEEIARAGRQGSVKGSRSVGLERVLS